jgi:ABC-type sugar transport system ATPase subunit
MVLIRLEGLTKIYPGGGGVRDITLDVPSGSHVIVVGPSGAGKSTLLRLIAGLESPDSGRIFFDDRDITRVPPHERIVAFVAQRPALYPHLNVRRNLTIGVELRTGLFTRADAATIQRAVEAADWLGIAPLLDRPVSDLSGGEQQRVVLGRAVVSRHPIWLLDEPLIHLDPVTRDQVRSQLHLLRGRLGPTMIEVTHDPADAAQGQHVAVLFDGRLAQVGPPAEVSARPKSRGVATSLGWPPMNFIDGPAAPNAGAGGANCALGVRPEDVGIGPAPAGATDLGEWVLVRVDALGPRPLWTLMRNGVRLRRWAEIDDVSSPHVQLHVKAGCLHRFDATTGKRLME